MYSFLSEDVKWMYGWYKSGDGFKNDKKNPLTQKKINKFDETEWDIGKNNKLFKALSDMCDQVNGSQKKHLPDTRVGDTSLSLHMITKVCNDKKDLDNRHDWHHYIATIYGGLNGPGQWEKYCRDFARLFFKIKNHPMFDHAYLCEIDNDCSDDVFTARIGFVLKHKKDKEGR